MQTCLTSERFDTAHSVCVKLLLWQGIQSLRLRTHLQKCKAIRFLNTINNRKAFRWYTRVWRKMGVVIQIRSVVIKEVYCGQYCGGF